MEELLARPSPGDPTAAGWTLAAPADLPGPLIGPVLGALADAGAREGVILVRTEGGPKRAEPRDAELMARIEAELASRDPEQRGMHVATRIEELVAGCAGAKERFAALATMSTEERGRALPSLIREILVSCDCPAWADEMVALLRTMTADDRPTATVPARLVDASERRPRKSWGEFLAELGEHDIPIEIDPASSSTDPLSASKTMFSTALGTVAMERTFVTGALDKTVIRKRLHERRGEIRDCYRDSLRADPLIAGRFVLGFAIEQDGSVANVSMSETTVSNTDLTECVKERASSWAFPSPYEGTVEVTTGFILR